MNETEIKLPVRDATALLARIAELGYLPVQARALERNVLFDFPDQRLRQARSMVRLRFSAGQALLTYKGAPAESRDYKIRPEIETRVEAGSNLREVLLHLGLQEIFRYEKFRTVYAPPAGAPEATGGHLMLDETPIGNYLEIEGPEAWIDQVAGRLGYSRTDYITASYAALYVDHCAAEGQPVGDMVFPSRES